MKIHFHNARSWFTDAFDKWKRSGQNDPERFISFLSSNGQNLYASSKRALIIFVVSRLGTAYADTLFVDTASKTISDRGCEAGNELDLPRNDDIGGTRETERRRQKRVMLI